MIDQHRHRSRAPERALTSTTDAWSGSTLIGTIVVVVIALGVLLYGVNKSITNADKTAASAPRTTGEGAAR
jgi:hypothetical protein